MADKKDYYEVLGIDKSAGDDEIKKAYRKMAKKYHPDLHPGDSEAEKNFKEVNEAYEILSDPTKKSRYDQFGHAGVDPNFGAGGGSYSGGFGDFGDLGDLFGSFFGGGFGGFGGRTANPNAPRRGADTSTTVNLSFEEAAKGTTKKIKVTRIENCSDCNGSGAAAGSSPKTCPTCNGSGHINVTQRTPFGAMQSTRVCDKCHGTGKIIDNPCKTCAGKGKVRRTKEQTVDIPAGVDDGQYVNIRGGGDMGSNGGPAGDLHINISVRPHPIFERNGFDVFCEIPITFTQAALGSKIIVPTLDGKVEFTIPAGTQNGDKFKLKGKGIQRLNYGGRGDQYVEVNIEVPKNLTKKQQELLKDFDKDTDDGNYKKRKSFFDKLKDIL